MRRLSLNAAIDVTLAVAIIVCALIWLPTEILGQDGARLPKEAVLAITAVIAAIGSLLRQSRQVDVAIFLPLSAYLFCSLLSALFATNGLFAGRALSISVGAIAIFVWQTEKNRDSDRCLSVASVLVACACVALVASLQAQWYASESGMVGTRPGATFGHRNFASHFLVLGLPAGYWLLSKTRGARALLSASGTALISYGIVLSRSRAAWLATATVAAVIVLSAMKAEESPEARRRWLRPIKTWVAAAVLGAVLAITIPTRLIWRSPTPWSDTLEKLVDYSSGSGRGRMLQYAHTLTMVRHKPLLGVGPGNWTVWYPVYAPADDPSLLHIYFPTTSLPHSDWLGIASERGLPALLCLLWTGLLVTWRAWRDWALSPSNSVAVIATSGALFIMGSFDAVLLNAGPAFASAILLGALSSSRPRPVSKRRVLGSIRGAMLAVLFCLSWKSLAAVRAAASYASNIERPRLEIALRLEPNDYLAHMLLAETLIKEGECVSAVQHVRLALRLHPNADGAKKLSDLCGAWTDIPR